MKYTYTDYYEPVDKAVHGKGIEDGAALPEGQRITGMDYIFAEKSEEHQTVR